MELEKENETFTKLLPELKEHEGKFALIHREELVDLYVSYDDALKEGYKRFGLTPFMVKQISASQQILFISRIAVPVSAAH